MARYVLYALDTRNARMDQQARFDAADDVAAIDLARRLSRAVYAELWSDHRRVAQFGDAPNSASTSHSMEGATAEVYATTEATWPIMF